MAIYTNYARYLKAKWFKEYLSAESVGDTYMVFGMGNPYWDAVNEESIQSMPVAPYNTTTLTIPTSMADNQFYDNTAQQYMLSSLPNTSSTPNPEQTVVNGAAAENSLIDHTGKFVPAFPCIWHSSTGDGPYLFPSKQGSGSPLESITQNTYQNYYIYSGHLYDVTHAPSSDLGLVDSISSLTNQELCYYSELCLRGKALNLTGTNLPPTLKTPVGLLGAVRCSIEFVRDAGPKGEYIEGTSEYFWYGDRYWQIVKDSDAKDDNITSNTELPHHLMFLSMVSPRDLCSELDLDQNLVPRQIAIYTRKRTSGRGPRFYRVEENIFNFGQYSKQDLGDAFANPSSVEVNIPATDRTGTLLNFTLPHIGSTDATTWPEGEFRFVLHDYIRGANRNAHSSDRFGYVVGF